MAKTSEKSAKTISEKKPVVKAESEKSVKTDKDKLVDAISKLSVLELAELTKALEEKFGVTAAVPVAAGAAAPTGGGAEAPAEEKTQFTVILKEIGANKIPVIKEVRAITGLGLKESKDLVEGAPKPVKENVDKEEAADIKKRLEGAGATVAVE